MFRTCVLQGKGVDGYEVAMRENKYKYVVKTDAGGV
jgi:hypothetical protein